jgi:L-ascorbate metabolism protein UlaG (beta-lactamase superfamily)
VLLTWLGHAQVFINAAGTTLLIDPWFGGGPTPQQPPSPYPDASCIPPPEFVCLTAVRDDRCSEATLDSLSREATVCLTPDVEGALSGLLSRLGFSHQLQLPWHQPCVIAPGFCLQALPGTHGAALLVTADGCTLLHGGTAPTPSPLPGMSVDFALVPVDGPTPGSLSATQSVAAFQTTVATWRPREAMPFANGWAQAAVSLDSILGQSLAIAHQHQTHLARLEPGDAWSPDTGALPRDTHLVGLGWQGGPKHERTPV